uniref:cytochrome c oxidase subunit II n=1 Tax=Miroplana shenzhensis TaxID=2597322 RepID=UPI001FAF20F1|nr:cytochrome c oxidase subunit II [Miroplana shenzhensis]UJT52302.1 cytochrome c oxidase subunit II [Miroplana shenzhensis]
MPGVENIINLHNVFICLLGLLSLLVFGVMFFYFRNIHIYNNYVEDDIVETTWTVIPMLILFVLAFPSLSCLYRNEFPYKTLVEMTLKVRGHQWYWTYEGTYCADQTIPSYMENDCVLRNFFTDDHPIIFSEDLIRVLCSSGDVIHSFAVGGFKWDCVPGRLNMGYMYLYDSGWIFGQCSEICGANHSFMPISLFVC